jgi:hypothetical protein
VISLLCVAAVALVVPTIVTWTAKKMDGNTTIQDTNAKNKNGHCPALKMQRSCHDHSLDKQKDTETRKQQHLSLVTPVIVNDNNNNLDNNNSRC